MSLVGRGWDRFRDLPKGPKVLARTKERTPSPDHPAQETMSEILHAFSRFSTGDSDFLSSCDMNDEASGAQKIEYAN